jgi:hypothetical protein
MLYLPLSKFPDSSETIVAAGAAVTAEGQALVRATGATSTGVTVSQGTSGELFAGFSIAGVSAAPFPAAYLSKVEKFIVPSSGTVQLAFTPQSGQVFVFDSTTGAAVPITGGVTVVANTVNGLTSGDTVLVTYKYAATVIQSRTMQGDIQPGGYVGNYVGQIGLIKRGLIYTDQFDASQNWFSPATINLGAGGILTVGGGGVALPGAYVVSPPNTDVPFLGIEFSAA